MGLEGSVDDATNSHTLSSRSVWINLLVTVLWLIMIWFILVILFRTIQNIDQISRDTSRMRQYLSTLFMMSRVNRPGDTNSSHGLERHRPRQAIGVDDMHDPI